LPPFAFFDLNIRFPLPSERRPRHHAAMRSDIPGRTPLPLLAVVEETVLPGEERVIGAPALDSATLTWLGALAPQTPLVLLPVTAAAEVPMLASGRYATRARFLGLDGTSARFAGEARVRVATAKGQKPPYDAEVDAAPGAAPDDRLREVVLNAAIALAKAPPGLVPPPPEQLVGAAAALLRALEGPGAARAALADGDVAAALAERTRAFFAEAPGREALSQVEANLRALTGEPKLGKGLRQRLHSATVEIARRLDLYDTTRAKDDEVDELELLRRKLDQAGLPQAVRSVVDRELRLLRQMKADHHDYPTHLRLLQLIGRLAWHADPLPPVDLDKVRRTLDRDHTGLEKPKRRILEYLAVRALGGEGRSTVLCLAGAPGVGKTSIARAMAEALGRPYVRIALGGVHDEAELRGHRLTYVGARPGRLIDGLAQAKSRSALVLLDEIDKLADDRQRSPLGALLEMLDPEQNSAFSDNYLSVPYDLSDCLFVATANDLGALPAYLRDRLEVIELDGYTTAEKAEIAARHLAPSLAKEHGIPPLEADAEVIGALVEGWTREAGVRQLRRELAAFYRERAVERLLPAEGAPDPLRPVRRDDLARVLGPPRFRPPSKADTLPPGVATGLSVSGHGGEILPLELVRLGPTERAPGKLAMTGSLGKVMRESAETVRAHLMAYREKYGLPADAFACDLHLHAPEAAVPKDGPSAGIALFTAMVSLLRGVPVRPDVAMTGELDLSGRVLAVGGIRAKCLAAERAGMARVLVPRANEADVPADLKIPVTYLQRAEEALVALAEGAE
jgi:ATP-dependent Lon protease